MLEKTQIYCYFLMVLLSLSFQTVLHIHQSIMQKKICPTYRTKKQKTKRLSHRSSKKKNEKKKKEKEEQKKMLLFFF